MVMFYDENPIKIVHRAWIGRLCNFYDVTRRKSHVLYDARPSAQAEKYKHVKKTFSSWVFTKYVA